MPQPPASLCLILIFFTCLFHPANSQKELVTLPPNLENITVNGLLLVSANPCSKTCGLGWKSEYYCGFSQSGTMINCSLTNTLCLISKDCGLLTKTTTIGANLSISCLDEAIETLGSSDFTFIWKIAKGLVTTDKYLFKIFPKRETKTPWMMTFKDVKEKNAGTYMCQVQNTRTMQVVKRVLIAVRVIPEELVQLSYYKVLSPDQKEELQVLEDNPVRKEKQTFWENAKALFKSTNVFVRVISTGLAIGIVVGVVLGTLYLCMSKKK